MATIVAGVIATAMATIVAGVIATAMSGVFFVYAFYMIFFNKDGVKPKDSTVIAEGIFESVRYLTKGSSNRENWLTLIHFSDGRAVVVDGNLEITKSLRGKKIQVTAFVYRGHLDGNIFKTDPEIKVLE